MRITHLLFVISLCAVVAFGQTDEGTIRPVKVDKPLKIDGLLNDAVWQTIEPITEFIQWEPDNGKPVSESTEVRVCYDSHYLYFGIRCYFKDPRQLRARVYERDSITIDNDDSFTIGIDSLNDDRTAFAFDTNALGTQLEVQLNEEGSMNSDWDAVWYSKGNIDDRGYTLEVAIPFFILRFKPAEEVEMGIILERIVQSRAEKSYWPALSRDHNFSNISQWGSLVGLKGIERGVDVEVRPYGIAGYSETSKESESTFDAGADVKWGITSNLTADLTFNTDFAQVESDDLQVNLTRFRLHYPEKRDFFLESADLFGFGGHETQVFFSRSIGIREGHEVPILAGARLFGMVGDTNIGLLTMQTRDTDEFQGENFTVARIKQNILGRSYFGGIVTSRRGDEATRDDTFGLDFTHIFGSNHMLWGMVAANRRHGISEGNWFVNTGAAYNTDRISARVVYKDIGPNFNPGIGFVRRNDQRTIYFRGEYKPRPNWGGIRQLFFSNEYFRIYNYNGDVETQLFQSGFTILFHSADQILSNVELWEELVPFSFYIAPDVVVPQGKYYATSAGGGFVTSRKRRYYSLVYLSRGGFYGGDITGLEFAFHMTFLPQLQMDIRSDVRAVDIPTGEFTSAISRLYLSYYLSPNLITRLALQYSSLFEEFVFNFRLRWIYAPNSEVWLVYDEGRDFTLTGSTLSDRALILKVVHNFNF